MGFRINRGIFQYKDTASDTFINKFKIDDRGDMIEVDADGNKITTYMRLGDKSHDADLLDGVDSSGFVKTTNNSTLNTDTRNTRGATRLFRNDSNSDYSVQHYWTGAHWFLRGYVGDTFHAEVRVGKADSADNATNASHLTGGDTSFRGLLYHNLNGDLNNYNVAGLYSAEYVGSTNIPLDQRGHFIQISDAGGTDVKTQWYYQSNGEKIHMRLMWGNQNWKEWRELITDSNIGSQSVNYASSAGNADTVDGYHATNAGGGIPVLNSNGYWDAPSWINVRGTGLYSSTANGAHFVPNPHSYGSWQITGTRGGWVGLHFGAGSGVTLMMNESESGIHREGSGWKYRHTGGKFYVHTGSNGGGTGYPVWHEGNLTPISYATGSFTVGGDPETYYPVMLNKSSRTTGRFVIYRDNVHQNETDRGAGRLVLNGYTSGWGHVPLTLHYETKISGTVLWKFLASNYRTGLMVVYLKGATTYYYKSEHGFTLYDANGSGEQKSDGRTVWMPNPAAENDVVFEGEAPSVLRIEHGVSYYDGTLKAGRFKGDGTDITNVNAETLDGIDSSGFLRSDAGDTASGKITFISNESAEPFSPLEIRGGGNHTGLYINPHTNKQAHIRFASNGALKWQIRAPFQDGANSPLKIYSWVSSADKFTFNHDGSLVASSFVGALSGNASTATTSTYLGSYYHADTWFRAKSDATPVKLYGNSRQMLFRTDGTTEAESGVGPYPFAWTYNGDASGNRIMLLHTDGRLWTSRYGWLDTAFDAAGSADAVNTALSEEIGNLSTAVTDNTTQISNNRTAILDKLGSSEKAADSNLLDGIDSGAFIQENQDRRYKTVRFTGEGSDSGNGNHPYAIYQEGGAWSYPYPDLVIAMHTGIKIGGHKSYGGTRFYSDAPKASGAIELLSVGNGDNHIRISNNLYIGSAGGWITDLLNAKETAGAAAAVDARIEEEILPSIDSKLDATAKAADADKLDGYDWMQSGKSVRANEFYADNWFRNYNSNEGMYNQATGQHWYSDGDDYWNIAGGSTFNAIRFRDEHAGTQRGLVGADSNNRIGFLDAGGAWAVRHDNDSGTLFYTDGETLEFRVGRDKVTGGYGTVQTDTTRSGWGGYSIAGRVVFMHDHSNSWGIYNDAQDEWMIYGTLNGQVELRHNGVKKLETTSGGVSVTGTVSATTFSGGLDWANVTNKPVIPVATEPIQATVEGGNNSTLASIAFSPGEGAATFTLADGQSFRLAFAR